MKSNPNPNRLISRLLEALIAPLWLPGLRDRVLLMPPGPIRVRVRARVRVRDRVLLILLGL